MSDLFTRPLRVYIVLIALAGWGLVSGLSLPISLFPNSNQPTIGVSIPLDSLSSEQFSQVYGRDLESSLQGLKIDSIGVKEVTADYRNQEASFKITFDWGADPEKSRREVQTLVDTKFANTSDAVRRGIGVYTWHQNSGFFALSFYSPLRSLDNLYETLEPIITPLKSQVTDADNFGLWNPSSKEITVTLIPQKLAQYEVSTVQVERAIQNSVVSLNGGNLKLGDKEYLIDLPKSTDGIEQLSQVRVSGRDRSAIFLKDIASIRLNVAKDNNQKFKTSGVDSLILFARPKEGGNVKNMADQIIEVISQAQKQWPEDVQYKILVNPSDFINDSVHGVIREVFLAAFLAVIVLFLFIGSFKNVVTAAIEIPISLLMAFILMKFAGMNLNLISLGGLALSAGMNVDASVVVLENIFRHFEGKDQNLTYQQKAQIVIEAVKEVRLPIIASTLASLVVFFPLIFTQGLTQSLLGDLAKAVVFSHGLSAIVALILVPTIRLQLISMGQSLEVHSPIEKYLVKMERAYTKSLSYFMQARKIQAAVFGIIIVSLPVLIMVVLPKLKTEVIGKPDSDWLIVGFTGPTLNSVKQVEGELDSLEMDLNKNFGSEILYTFTQIWSTHEGEIMVRLKDKKKITELITKAEELYKNTSTKFYWVTQWNPSELQIPDPPQLRVEIVGGDPQIRLDRAQDLQAKLQENGVFDRVNVSPTAEREKEIRVVPFFNSGLESEVLSRQELSHYLRVATKGIYAERIFQNRQELPIYLRLDTEIASSLDQLKALPIGFDNKLVPLGALAKLTIEPREPRIYRENRKSMVLLTAGLNKSNEGNSKDKKKQAHSLIEEFKKSKPEASTTEPVIMDVQPDKDLQASLDQLKWAVAISIFLVFVTMVLQLGDVVHSLLVLVAIPLGFIGVLLSLWIFKSSLSLNSGLGTILLNGIAVANSIILVDFIRKLHARGKDALSAVLEASTTRLRPILMTSLCTVLGMLPVALGLGEGGKILQPLGIAVCGGLWVSMMLTLYIVPTLQYLYLSRKGKKK